MILVDTNILLYAVNKDSVLHAKANEALENLVNSGENWALSWGIIYEFLRVATHPRVFPKPLTFDRAWTFVTELTNCSSCSLLGETPLHREMVETCRKEVGQLQGNLLHDFHQAVLMREHVVIHVLTCDTDFRLFKWVRPREL